MRSDFFSFSSSELLARSHYWCPFGRAPYKEPQEIIVGVLPNEALTLLQMLLQKWLIRLNKSIIKGLVFEYIYNVFIFGWSLIWSSMNVRYTSYSCCFLQKRGITSVKNVWYTKTVPHPSYIQEISKDLFGSITANLVLIVRRAKISRWESEQTC